MLLFVALVLTRFDRVALRRFENAILLGGVLVVAYGLVQLVFLGGLPTPDGGAARFGNDLLGPEQPGRGLAPPHRDRDRAGAVGDRCGPGWSTAALLLLLIFGVLMTGSRGGLLAAVVDLLAVLFLGTSGGAAAFAVVGGRRWC